MFKNFLNENLQYICILIHWVVIIIVKKTQNRRNCFNTYSTLLQKIKRNLFSIYKQIFVEENIIEWPIKDFQT